MTVEAAVLFPLVVILILCLFQMVDFLKVRSSLQLAADAAARYGAELHRPGRGRNGDTPAGLYAYILPPSDVKDAVRGYFAETAAEELNRAFPLGDVEVTVSPGLFTCAVEVTARCPYRFLGEGAFFGILPELNMSVRGRARSNDAAAFLRFSDLVSELAESGRAGEIGADIKTYLTGKIS